MSRNSISIGLITTASLLALAIGLIMFGQRIYAPAVPPADHAKVVMVWPETATAKQIKVGREHDTTRPFIGNLVAEKRVQRITNVGKAELHFWPAPSGTNTGTSVVVCPGGGFTVLAWDLEGTEIATWLNSIGVNAFILKHRVPTDKQASPISGPTEDLQRAIALVRHNAEKWNLNANRVGAVGFSSGSLMILKAALNTRYYEAVDEVDQQSCRPDFIIPVYGAPLVDFDGNRGAGSIVDGMELTEDSPNAFLVHARDDFVPVENALVLAKLYEEVGVPAECHVFDAGGHGFGARPVADLPITRWPQLCESWMRKNGWLELAANQKVVCELVTDEALTGPLSPPADESSPPTGTAGTDKKSDRPVLTPVRPLLSTTL